MVERAVKPGCEVLVENPPAWFSSKRLGVLSNQASVTRSFEHVNALVAAAGGRITCLFSPQHGFHMEKQANMVESRDGWEPLLGLPVYSLYGAVRQPTPEMFSHIDVLLIDLQDVGTRVYTYGTTMGLCLETAAATGTKIVVLDRPNPIGGLAMEGNLVRDNHRSFVGRYRVPMRHGLTMGELARFIVKRCGVDADLEVIAMEGWDRSLQFPETGLHWTFPSPNMPSWETALVYPGMVLFEGTNVSEGRGTTLPFQLFGAPFIDPVELGGRLARRRLEGVAFRPVSFEPVFDKWAGEVCRGFQLHITDAEKIRPYRLGLILLQELMDLYPDGFRWLQPPYEYEREKLPIDILIGDGALRRKLEEGTDVDELEGSWMEELGRYREDCASCLIYE